MGNKRVGLARTQALIENLKRELNLSTSTTLKNAALTVASTATYGAGAVSTEIAPQTFVQNIGGEIVTTILLDLTGLKKKNDVGDVIGLDGGGAAYLLQWNTTTHGIPYKIEMSCLELPACASNNLLDFDVIAVDESNLAYDGDAAGGTNPVAMFAAAGNTAKGTTIRNLTAGAVASDQYLYLCDGATSTGADTFTAGKLVIRFYGRVTF
tara:strand:- start:238 stop:867 length:630 start_codon:yes stop_codon:yes gene_type:complete